MISILMATYNGQAFIAEQIESILNQSCQSYVLYINDDASTDDTFDIVKRFAAEFPDKIIATKNSVNSGNAKHNFIDMMIRIKDDYVMLCDQDDIWLPDKIRITFDRIQELESEFGTDAPILVHTDLRVVSQDIDCIISLSFREAMNSDFSRTKLRDQIVQNTLTGCTVMYNRSMASLIIKKPNFMVMHDWWLMLIASAFGRIDSLNKQTVLYRQHDKNSIGAYDTRTLSYKLNKLRRYEDIKRALAETYLQSQSLLDMYRDKLDAEQVKLLETYCQIPDMPKFKRWQTIWQLGTFKNGLSRKIAQFIFI